MSSCSTHAGHPPAVVRERAQLEKRAVSEINGQIKSPLFSDKCTDYTSALSSTRRNKKECLDKKPMLSRRGLINNQAQNHLSRFQLISIENADSAKDK